MGLFEEHRENRCLKLSTAVSWCLVSSNSSSVPPAVVRYNSKKGWGCEDSPVE